MRAVLGGGKPAIAKARRQLAHLYYQVNVDRGVLDRAAKLGPGNVLQSLDAVHLASAQTIGGDLRAVVTYDQRMAAAAVAMGLPVEVPA